ncbi:MAG: hypothetical protein IPO94_15920 [Saprospiraceae bacterium]|nr:hypothetical protein [Saprospiraceae bacterium]
MQIYFIHYGNSWTQQAKLIASDGAGDDRFGSSVSISGDYAMIGAYFDDVGDNSNQGSAYIFYRKGTTWSLQTTLVSENGDANDNFGSSVSIYGEFAQKRTQFSSCKAFYRNNMEWIQKAILQPNPIQQFCEFGESVCIRNRIVAYCFMILARLY